MLVSWYRYSDVWINTHYEWTKICGVPVLIDCFLPITSAATNFAFTVISSKNGFVRSTYLTRFQRLALENGLELGFYGSLFNTNPKDLRGAAKYSQQFYEKKIHVAHQYLFCFCFENMIRPDYVTEKLFHCLLAGSLPVYMGAPEAADFIPGGAGSFVNAMDFADEFDLLQYLVYLSTNRTAYLEYFTWRQKSFQPVFQEMHRYSMELDGENSFACRMCKWYQNMYCSA
jgi:hypothetical protein